MGMMEDPSLGGDNLVALLFPFSLYILYHDFDNFFKLWELSNFAHVGSYISWTYNSFGHYVCTIAAMTHRISTGKRKNFDKRKNLICRCVGARYNFPLPQITRMSATYHASTVLTSVGAHILRISTTYILRTEGKARLWCLCPVPVTLVPFPLMSRLFRCPVSRLVPL